MLTKINIKLYSGSTSVGAVFAEHFIRTIGDFLRRLVFERGDGKWIDVIPKITKQYFDGIPSSTKLTPFQASSKKNEGFFYKNLLDKRK